MNLQNPLNCSGVGRLVEILIATKPTSEMTSLTRVHAVPGRGLDGDRYFLGNGTFSPHPQKPDFEVTLIEQENVDSFVAQSGLAFAAKQARRNLVTRDIRLNDLVGKEFLAGGVLLRGLRLCEPCAHLAKLSYPETLKGLVHKGGLRAQILSEGYICVDDEIRSVPNLNSARNNPDR